MGFNSGNFVVKLKKKNLRELGQTSLFELCHQARPKALQMYALRQGRNKPCLTKETKEFITKTKGVKEFITKKININSNLIK